MCGRSTSKARNGARSTSLRTWRPPANSPRAGTRRRRPRRPDAMEALEIPVGDGRVSGLFLRPPDAKALYVFAHGAGAGMTHMSMTSNAEGLAERGIATLRYQFPYMEKGSRRPDPPRVAQAAVRAAAAKTVE